MKTSAERGDPDAQNQLGAMYLEGTGVEKDEKSAFYWFRKSAEQENAFGRYNLARCYENGQGVEKDDCAAF